MSSLNKGLGRGIDALIPPDFDSSLLLEENERIQKIAVEAIEPGAHQPRQYFDEQAMAELAQSIKQHGLLQPIVVTPKGSGFEIVAGERRWRAAKQIGLKSIPAIVRTTKQLERLEISLVENVQRVDLNPLEQAASLLRLHDQFNISYDKIARRLGKGTSTITNIVRLLTLPTEAREALIHNEISEGHARAILALAPVPPKQQELLTMIKKHHWTVRQAERFVTAYKNGVQSSKAASARTAATTPETERLSKVLSARVSIWRTANGGRLEIGFKSDEDLERILKRLSEA